MKKCLTILFKSTKIGEALREVLLLLTGLISAVFGIIQALMLKTALFSFTAGKYTVTAALVFAKLLLYGGWALLTVFVFSDTLIQSLAGYTAGLLCPAIALFVYYGKHATAGTEGDTDGNGNDN